MSQFARLALSYLGWLGLACYLLLGTQGCAGSRQDRWAPDAELVEAAVDASEAWCVATDGRYCPVIVARGGMPMAVSDDESRTEEGRLVCGLARMIQYDDGTMDPSLIRISLTAIDAGMCRFDRARPRTRHEQLVSVLTHELGHAGGLRDVDDPERMMHWSADSVGEISDVDVAEIGAINGW